ncbi:MAG TPA: CPBP family intramembrane glutamic endopeptidase [Candidatus Limnocylindrales bacterium]|nr:CPBP family intramembrane glutamic endopeptidase [Candidatus Limnocylindrales bacterium]
MRVSAAAAVWFVYLIVALVLLEFLTGFPYAAAVGLGGLGLAAVAPPPVGLRLRPDVADLAGALGVYAVCVGLFFLAFQVFTVDNVAGLFFAFAGALLVGVVAPLIHVVIVQGRALSDLGLTRERLPEILVLAALLAAVQAVLTLPKVSFGPPETWIPLLGMALAVGFFEALFFRAYIVTIFEPMFGTVGAVVGSAGLYALYHVGYGMGPTEMVFLFGLGIVYVVAYLVARNLLVIWPLLTPLGGFFNNARAGDIELPLIAVLGFVDILGVMLAAIFLVHRWQRRHAAELRREPVAR